MVNALFFVVRNVKIIKENNQVFLALVFTQGQDKKNIY